MKKEKPCIFLWKTLDDYLVCPFRWLDSVQWLNLFSNKRQINGETSSAISDAPIFVFAACWRTGSTLVQRIINASEEVFIWGEPAFLPEALNLFERNKNHFDRASYSRKKTLGESGQWIPIISPSPERVSVALRSYFDALYIAETQELGFSRWGFKEVRPGAINHMELLAKLYPDAKFIFLVRDPYETYRSIKGKKFHARFKEPLQPVRVWEENVRQCLLEHNALENCIFRLKYEDLTEDDIKARQVLEQLMVFLTLPVTQKMFDELSIKVDSSGQDKKLEKQEIVDIDTIVSESASVLGYDMPSLNG